MKVWLVFDVGTGSTKATVITTEGQIIRDASATYNTYAHGDGKIEQDATDWWSAILETVKALGYPQVDAISITGQMQSVILLDERGDLLRPVILYSDTRAHREAEQVEQRIGREELRQLTGNYQDAGSLLAKLRWLMQHEPVMTRQAHYLLMGAADYITFRLTDQAVTDTTTASTTGLLNLNTRQWLDSTTLTTLELKEIEPLLPALVHGGAQIGSLTQKAADESGLPAGIPVFHAPGDAGANTLGTGSGMEGSANAYVGTSGWIALTAPAPAHSPGVLTLAHPHPQQFIQVAPLMTAGGNLEWVINLFQQEDYAEAIQQAISRQPSPLIYLPYLRGERAPFSDPFARAVLVGIHDGIEKADVYRAVLEGVIFAYRHCLEVLISASLETLILTGGGTRSEAWSQLFADILGIPVVIAPEPEYGGVRGALISSLVAIGQRPLYSGFLPSSQVTLMPSNTYRQHYNHQYRLFREVYPALQTVFTKLHAP